MTISFLPQTAEGMPATTQARDLPAPGFFKLWLSSIFVYFFPPLSRLWRRARWHNVMLVTLTNVLAGAYWLWCVLRIEYMWSTATKPILEERWEPQQYAAAGGHIISQWLDGWHNLAGAERIALVVGSVMCSVLPFAFFFFVLLPFGARPGPNPACARHVARTTLLATGMVQVLGAAFFLLYFISAGATGWVAANGKALPLDGTSVTSAGLFVLAGSIVWIMPVLIAAVRREYRDAADMPAAHDPWCDNCGYNLTGIGTAGRCPECGRGVQESLGEMVRQPTSWEARPRLRNVGTIVRQVRMLVFEPRRLFFSMPTLTGQRAAQRWLLWSMLLIFLAALPIVPTIYLVLHNFIWTEFNWVTVSGSLVMGLTWALFGVMMVGIETGGIAYWSRMRGHPMGGVYLSASSKVTCYSSILMLPWVILGGAQLVGMLYWELNRQTLMHGWHISIRMEQVLVALSMGVAHIGGLIWYELTVYRGIRAIQYANK